MATLWYYGRDGKKLGPFSQMQLKEMAAGGTIRPMDMVWKEGVEQGALASEIKNLFLRPVLKSTDSIDAALRAAESTPVHDNEAPAVIVSDSPVPDEEPDAPKAKPKVPEKKKGRANAIKGCDIVSQDGSYARYRKKCLRCGHKDNACHSIPILNKTIKANYFCPKCRKRSEVAIQCQA